jgi:hypothetical protein
LDYAIKFLAAKEAISRVNSLANKWQKIAGHQWLKPVILTIWEAEIGRIVVQGQRGQIVPETPISKITRAKMDWRCGFSGKVPALQVCSPEFKFQSPPLPAPKRK